VFFLLLPLRLRLFLFLFLLLLVVIFLQVEAGVLPHLISVIATSRDLAVLQFAAQALSILGRHPKNRVLIVKQVS
jgi:hypothetical protein